MHKWLRHAACPDNYKYKMWCAAVCKQTLCACSFLPVVLQLRFETASLQDLTGLFIHQLTQMMLDVLHQAHMLALTALLLSRDGADSC